MLPAGIFRKQHVSAQAGPCSIFLHARHCWNGCMRVKINHTTTKCEKVKWWKQMQCKDIVEGRNFDLQIFSQGQLKTCKQKPCKGNFKNYGWLYESTFYEITFTEKYCHSSNYAPAEYSRQKLRTESSTKNEFLFWRNDINRKIVLFPHLIIPFSVFMLKTLQANCRCRKKGKGKTNEVRGRESQDIAIWNSYGAHKFYGKLYCGRSCSSKSKTQMLISARRHFLKNGDSAAMSVISTVCMVESLPTPLMTKLPISPELFVRFYTFWNVPWSFTFFRAHFKFYRYSRCFLFVLVFLPYEFWSFQKKRRPK